MSKRGRLSLYFSRDVRCVQHKNGRCVDYLPFALNSFPIFSGSAAIWNVGIDNWSGSTGGLATTRHDKN